MALSDKTKRWLAKNAGVSLKGRTAVVTGANSGVGYKTAETLAYLGADVVLTCRNPARAAAARDALAAEYPGSGFSVAELDLADFSSVDAFVDGIAARGDNIDIFVNNAGAFRHPGEKTKQGFDLVMGTNYLGVYYLTEKLLPYLSSLPHEVAYINTVSLVHKYARTDFGDFRCDNKGRALAVYAESKLCLAKYSYYLSGKNGGGNVRVFMDHPGIAITPLGVNAFGPVIAKLSRVVRPVFNSPEKSSLAVAYIAAHRVPAGSIVGPTKFFGGWGYPKINRVARKVKTGAEELIAFTEKETGSARGLEK